MLSAQRADTRQEDTVVALVAPALKVSHIGTRTGGEQWVTGHWCAAPAGVAQADLDAWTDSVASAWATLLTTLTTSGSTDTRYTDTKVSYYAAGSTSAVLQSDNAAHAQSMTGTTKHPYQVAVVASLRTAIPTRKTRGRMYLPLDAMAMGSAGQYNSTQVNNVGAAMKAYLDAVRALTIVGSATHPVVASHVSGLQTEISTVIVDSIPDIQRRRADKLVPTTISTNAL